MHERVVCRTPCIVEGGKVVSETVLTKMYSMLRNEAVRRRARAVLESDLEEMECGVHWGDTEHTVFGLTRSCRVGIG